MDTQTMAALSVMVALWFGAAPAHTKPNDQDGKAMAIVVGSLLYDIKQHEEKLGTGVQLHAALRERVLRSQDPPEYLERSQQGIDELRAAIALRKSLLAQAPRLAALLRRQDIDVEGASIASVAKILSSRRGVTVKVDPRVPATLLCTIRAEGVPLATILETMAEQYQLMLAPEPEGVVIRRWPSLELNGTRQAARGKLAPWSDDWGIRPTFFLNDFTPAGMPSDPKVRMDAAILPIAGSMAMSMSLLREGITSSDGAGSIGLTALGDHTFVTARAGKGPRGEAGTWFTVFQVDGVEVKRFFTVFDPARGERVNHDRSR
jgi:hypothetical protein